MTDKSVLDDAKLSKFHVTTAIAGTAGQFCDGYVLGIIAPALPVFMLSHDVSPLLSGLIGASALFGLFIGASIFGWLTDKVGRRKLFIADLVLIVLLSLAQLAVTDAIQLLILRVLLGIAIGADYAIAPTMVAEFAPRKYRAVMLAAGPAMWTVGYVAAFAVGTALHSSGNDAWKWMLASSAVPALLVLALRWNTPESPRWLAARGRTDEALAIVRQRVDPNATLADVMQEDGSGEGSLLELFSRKHRKRLAFVCLFWFCQVVPYFAVFTFLPTILENLTLGEGFTQTLIVNVFLLVGSVIGIVLISRIGRRPYTLGSFALLTLSTAAIGIWQNAPTMYIVACFAIFALVSSAMSTLDVVYPTELFPTDIRATATGLAVSFSRIGAAIGTFLLPLGMDLYGAHTVTLITAAVAGVGLLVSIGWAPETRGLTLSAAAHDDPADTEDAAGARRNITSL